MITPLAWYHAHIESALLKVNDESKAFKLKILFSSWRGAKELLEVHRWADHFLQAHQASVHRLLSRMFLERADVALHVCLGAWWQLVQVKAKMNARLSGQERRKRDHAKHNQVMDKALLKWGESDNALLSHQIISNWCNFVTSEVGMRFREMRHAKVRRLLYKLGAKNEQISLHACLRAWWADVVDYNKNVHRELCSSLEQKHDHIIDKALLCWGGQDDTLLMDTVLHEWVAYVAEEREFNFQAQLLTERQAATAAHDAKIEAVLIKMNRGDNRLITSIAIKAWSDAAILPKRIAHVDNLSKKAEHLGMMHRQDVPRLLNLLIASDCTIKQHACLGVWKELLVQKQQMMHFSQYQKYAEKFKGQHSNLAYKSTFLLTLKDSQWTSRLVLSTWSACAHLGAQRKAELKEHAEDVLYVTQNSEYVIDRALEKWGLENECILSHVAWHAWEKYVVDAVRIRGLSEVQKQAEAHLALTQRNHGEFTDKAMILWGNHDLALLQHGCLHAWNDMVKADVEAQNMAEALRLKHLHNEKVLKALLQVDSGQAYAVVFRIWREVMQMEQAWRDEVKWREHLDATQKNQDEFTDKAIFLWGNRDVDLLQHECLHAWHRKIKVDHAADVESKRMANCRRNHSEFTDKAVVLWGNHDADLLQHECLHAWYRKLKAEKYEWRIEKAARDQGKWKAYHCAAQKRHEEFTDKAIVLWGNHDVELLQHECLHAWHRKVRADREAQRADSEAQRADSEAQNFFEKTAERKRLKQLHDEKVLKTLLLLDSNQTYVLLFGWWKEITNEAKFDLAMSKVVRGNTRVQKVHRNNVLLLLEKVADSSDDVFLYSTFNGWRQTVVDKKYVEHISRENALWAQFFQHRNKVSQAMDVTSAVWCDRHSAMLVCLVLQRWYHAFHETAAKKYSIDLLMHELMEFEREIHWYAEPCLGLQNLCSFQGKVIESLEEEVAELYVDAEENSKSLMDIEASLRMLGESRQPKLSETL